MFAMLLATAPLDATSSATDSFVGFSLQPPLGQVIALVIYCLASLVAVSVAIANRHAFKDILSEKAVMPAMRDLGDAGQTAPTSFSRFAGLIGIVYLTAFLWGIGFFVLAYIWVDPAKIGQVVANCGQFLMAGSALFAPYAFNQLAQVFTAKEANTSAAASQGSYSSADVTRALAPKG
jgi:hypothetical protein